MSGSDSKEMTVEPQQQNSNDNMTEDPKQQSDFDYNEDTTLPDLQAIKNNYYKTKVNGSLTMEQIDFLKNLELSITKKNQKNIEYSNLLRKTGIPLNDDIHKSIESASINGETSKDWNQFVAANQKLRQIYETEIDNLRKEKKNSMYSNNNITQKSNSSTNNSTNSTNNKKRPNATTISYSELYDLPNKQQKSDNNQTASNSKKPQDGDVYVNDDSKNEESDKTDSWTKFWTRRPEITKDEDRILSEMMNNTKGSKIQYNTVYDVQAKKK
jgi:hypothetical protein